MKNFKLRLISRASAFSQEVSCTCHSKKAELFGAAMRHVLVENRTISPDMKTAVSLEVLSHVILITRLPDRLPWSDCRVCKFPLIFLSLYLAAVFIGMEFFGSNRDVSFGGLKAV